MFEHKDYNREWMRQYRVEMRAKRLIMRGKCPVCEILLISVYHVGCKYLDGPDAIHPPHKDE